MNWDEKQVITVATHGCPHHLDELVGVALFRRWAEVRGQDITVDFLSRQHIAAGVDHYDVLIDIGMVFDPARGRFDHHQASPDVEGRSAAGLVFDSLFADHPAHALLLPIIREVDRLDTSPPPMGLGASRLTLGALLKVVGGFEHDENRSYACRDLVDELVEDWFDQAHAAIQAALTVDAAEKEGGGIFLEAHGVYGPGLMDYVRESTPYLFVGFPAGPERYHVVAVRDGDGTNRVVFPAALTGASFVHKNGFLAVFPQAAAAQASIALWRSPRVATTPETGERTGA